MPAKLFRFSVVCMRSGALWEFGAEHATLDGAFKAGAVAAPTAFGRGALRMFRFRFENTRTAEFSAAIGQGCDVLEAWADLLKGARDTFRPKNDGRSREQNGLTVLLPARPGDTFAKGRAVARSVESFESDETFADEQRRLRIEAERKRIELLNAGRVTPAGVKVA